MFVIKNIFTGMLADKDCDGEHNVTPTNDLFLAKVFIDDFIAPFPP